MRSGGRAGWRARRLDVLLVATLVVAFALRAWPLTRFALWGSDTGEYVGLAARLASDGFLSTEYDGWGIAYPWFPGFTVLAGALSATTGLDAERAVQLLGPALGTLVVLGVFLLARRITDDPLASLAGAALVATVAPHVIVTSHGMPGTLGHVFVVAALLALVAAIRDRRFAAPLALVCVALLATHHLSTYFLVGIVAGAAFLREFGRRAWSRERLTVEAPLVLALAGAASVYWLSVPVFRDRIVADLADTSPWLAAAAFLALLLALPLVVLARRRLAPGFVHHARLPGPRFWSVVSFGGFLAAFAAVLLLTRAPVPGTSIALTRETLLYVTPVLAALALAGLGGAMLFFRRDGMLVVGWAAAILISLVASAARANEVVPAFRHVEYLMEPAAILAGVGWIGAWRWLMLASNAREKVVVTRFAVALAGVLLVVLAAMSQPPREALGGYEEGITHAERDAIVWLRENRATLGEDPLVAADHRLSSATFGLTGIDATWDSARLTFHASTFDEASSEMRDLSVPSGDRRRVDYVLLSPATRAGVIVSQTEPARPMNDSSWAKFFIDTEHFEEVYREPGVVDGRDGVYVFRVRWAPAS